MNQIAKIKKVDVDNSEQLMPWTGLGTKVAEKDSLDTIIKKANFEWQAKRTPVLFVSGDEIHTGTSDVIYRSDTKYQLGVVSDKYNIVQPREVISFYKDLVSLEGWKLDVIGQLDGGRRIWALAKTNTSFFAGDDTDDIVDIYLLLTTTFDGSSATIGKFTSIRVACGNSLTLAVGKNEGLGKVKVHHKAEFISKKVKEKLQIYKKASEVMEQQVKQLTEKQITDEQAVRFLIDTLEREGAELDDLSVRQTNIIASVLELYKGNGLGSNWKSSRGTAWGLLNALTQHVDYNVGRTDNNRIRSAWFGLGETLKINAMKKLLEI